MLKKSDCFLVFELGLGGGGVVVRMVVGISSALLPSVMLKKVRERG